MGSTVSARRRVGSASLSRVGSTAGAAATGAAQHASATRSVIPLVFYLKKTSPNPEMEFLDIYLTNDSNLLLHGIHSPFF
jgi:hypothetical protein